MPDNSTREPLITFKHPATQQWQMTVEQQKAAGLIATINRSIHPRNWSKSTPRQRTSSNDS